MPTEKYFVGYCDHICNSWLVQNALVAGQSLWLLSLYKKEICPVEIPFVNFKKLVKYMSKDLKANLSLFLRGKYLEHREGKERNEGTGFLMFGKLIGN